MTVCRYCNNGVIRVFRCDDSFEDEACWHCQPLYGPHTLEDYMWLAVDAEVSRRQWNRKMGGGDETEFYRKAEA